MTPGQLRKLAESIERGELKATDDEFAYRLRNEAALMERHAELERELAAKAEECEALRKDAERYRWMRKQPTADIYACWYPPVFPAGDSPAQRDASIDAALRGTP